MDEFSLDRPELTGTLISLEFGPGGRIQQLWAADPALPDQNEEFQFVISPLSLGEEFAEDYFPGTVLLGARINADDPWMLSRNGDAGIPDDGEDPSKVSFEYEFPLLPEIHGTGKFYEQPGPIPRICWDLEIVNNGNHTLEIGEVGFPFALNSIYEGFPRSEEGMAEMLKDRLYVHKFIGGAASYLFAQRMNAEPPGLLIFPGEDTRWEFYNHVPASLHTPFRWEGIPVVYAHSRAAIEREGWGTWFNDHSSLMLEPGDSKRFQTCFAPADRDRFDAVGPTLAASGRPSIKLLPAAVVPYDVGVAVEVAGATPTQFYANVEAELETDSDEEGGFCFIQPQEPGLAKLSFEDTLGRESMVHLLFTEPIESLIEARAKWIVDHQIHREEGGNLYQAILPADIGVEEQLADPADYGTPFGIESSLSDALFLAEKNTIFPDAGQIEILENYCSEFLLDDVQNPGDGSVGVVFSDGKSISSNTGHAPAYPLTFTLYHTLYRVACITDTAKRPKHYLRLAGQTALAMFRHVPTSAYRGVGVPLMRNLHDLLEDLKREGETTLADKIQQAIATDGRAVRTSSAAFGRHVWSMEEFEQAFFGPWISAPRADRDELLSLAFAGRSLSPSWWWYGTDKRMLDEAEVPHPAMADKGELALGPTTVANSLMLFDTLDKDQQYLPDSWLRMAFGGMLSVWALVRADGAASMGFCPDSASQQFGVSALTGDVGLGLYRYLRWVSAYVLPTRQSGVVTFGCHFSISTQPDGTEEYTVRPWDGVNRRIVVRQLGVEVSTNFGRIIELRFDARKRNASILMQNPSERDHQAVLIVRGLWGTRADVSGTAITADPQDEGALRVPVSLTAQRDTRIEIRVTG